MCEIAFGDVVVYCVSVCYTVYCVLVCAGFATASIWGHDEKVLAIRNITNIHLVSMLSPDLRVPHTLGVVVEQMHHALCLMRFLYRNSKS